MGHGFFFSGYNLETVMMWFGMVAILLLLNEVARKQKWFAVIVFFVTPFTVLGLVLGDVLHSPSGETWFGWVKCFSALAGVYGFMLIRYFKKVQKSKFAYYFPFAILAINILEAVYKDFEVFATVPVRIIDNAGLVVQGGPWNVLNALAGIMCVLTLTGWMGITVARTKSRDMVWADQVWFWIIAYDLWNIAYCYNCISTRALYAGVLLNVVATIAEFCFQRGAWLQHRAYTLAMFATFSLAFDYTAFGAFKVEATYSEGALITLSVLAFAMNLAVLCYELAVIIKRKKNPLKQVMYDHTNFYRNNLLCNNLLDIHIENEEKKYHKDKYTNL